MVIFPVLYGLCQLVEIAVAICIFQTWVFIHRHDVTEEDITSVLDTTLLTSVPVPAHKLSQVNSYISHFNLLDPYKGLS